MATITIGKTTVIIQMKKLLQVCFWLIVCAGLCAGAYFADSVRREEEVRPSCFTAYIAADSVFQETWSIEKPSCRNDSYVPAGMYCSDNRKPKFNITMPRCVYQLAFTLPGSNETVKLTAGSRSDPLEECLPPAFAANATRASYNALLASPKDTLSLRTSACEERDRQVQGFMILTCMCAILAFSVSGVLVCYMFAAVTTGKVAADPAEKPQPVIAWEDRSSTDGSSADANADDLRSSAASSSAVPDGRPSFEDPNVTSPGAIVLIVQGEPSPDEWTNGLNEQEGAGLPGGC